jgi:hypothetical protein
LLLLWLLVHSLWPSTARTAPATASLPFVTRVVAPRGAVRHRRAACGGVIAARSHRRSAHGRIDRAYRRLAGGRAVVGGRRGGVIIGGTPSVRGSGCVIGHRFGWSALCGGTLRTHAAGAATTWSHDFPSGAHSWCAGVDLCTAWSEMATMLRGGTGERFRGDGRVPFTVHRARGSERARLLAADGRLLLAPASPAPDS